MKPLMVNTIPPKLFISYAHADGETTVKEFWRNLRDQLKLPYRSWDKWDDKQILVGQDWDSTIALALEQGCNCCLGLLGLVWVRAHVNQIFGSMQVRTLSRRYSSSRSPYARRWMTRILLLSPSTKPSETLFSGLQ